MVQKGKRTSAGLKRLAFAVEMSGNRGMRLTHVLAQFQREPDDRWRCFCVKHGEPDYKFLLGLFVIAVHTARSVMAFQSPKDDRATNKTPGAVAFSSDDIRNLATYFFNLKEMQSDGTYRNYRQLPRRLRDGGLSLFTVHSNVGRKSPYIRASASALRPGVLTFFRTTDYSAILPSSWSQNGVAVSVSINTEPSLDLIELADWVGVMSTKIAWIRPKDDSKSTKRKALGIRGLGPLMQAARGEASSFLAKQVHSEKGNRYIERSLEIGRFPAKHEECDGGQHFRDPALLGRIWEGIANNALLPPGRNYFLVSPSGSGKTTYLRHLQLTLLERHHILALYCTASEIVNRDATDLYSLCTSIFEPRFALQTTRTRGGLVMDCFAAGKVVLLVDAVDNLGSPGGNCATLVETLLRAVGQGRVMFAGRPSAARWCEEMKDLAFIRLKPFDDTALRVYFGDRFEEALGLCSWNLDIVESPMLAYLIREVLNNGQGHTLRSRWDLYQRFLNYILYHHPSNRQTHDHEGWVSSVRDALSEISFASIDRDPPIWTCLPWAFLQSLAPGIREGLGRLSSTGIVDLLETENASDAICLNFLHQSFQEYLAALWASVNSVGEDKLVDEYWNPKWKEVMRFLAGRPGIQLVERIYRPAEQDTPIHSRLVAAARLADEQPEIPRALHSDIVVRLQQLLPHYVFGSAAHHSLVAMGTPSSQAIAWQAITGPQPMPFMFSLWYRDCTYLRALYTPERLSQLVDDLAAGGPTGIVVDSLCRAWSCRISSQAANRFISRYDWPNDRFPYPLAGLVSRLNPPARRDLIARLLAQCARDCELAVQFLEQMCDSGARFTESEIGHIIDASAASTNPRRMVRLLESMAQSLSQTQIVKLENIYWRGDAQRRKVILQDAPGICCRFADSVVDGMVRGLEEADVELQRAAAWAMAQMSGRLTRKQCDIIASWFRRDRDNPSAVRCFVATAADVTSRDAALVLGGLTHDNRWMRVAALESAERMRSHVRGEHIQRIERLLEGSNTMFRRLQLGEESVLPLEIGEERNCAIAALSAFVDVLPDSALWCVLESLTPFDRDREHLLRPSLVRFGRRLSRGMISWIVKRICTDPRARIQPVQAFVELLMPIAEVSEVELRCLCRALGVAHMGCADHIARFLGRIHEKGGLAGITQANIGSLGEDFWNRYQEEVDVFVWTALEPCGAVVDELMGKGYGDCMVSACGSSGDDSVDRF